MTSYDGVKRHCKTCEWNFKGVCANEFYGQKISSIKELKSKTFECGSWSIGLDAWLTKIEKL